ncbi:multiple monosaccharide ABC transporter ATP-binding protein [Rhizobium rosettiformans]|jgi:putative multiple sugar transport system ATP-binding protein|uniref:Sugar ABC transporter ATP-binding protein n=2 Tax=Rhizobium rosettiformans TaxID=1368430 RepID=A0A4S8Q3X0_9HYPH|nr:multiple monosaccharide ABC transporter ATP-binding protein [Rhizobium rosettiformans]MBA4796782.1 sugar ABC transporter ATP-binding protein [Hyphomicrobiales bacterium]MBB5275495.1 putative multiple sugar transport system ATP-binding protein [Rhizobium rosettiformans]MDR7030060.1 putative multiple sugar transport system ATP-binding protein [Rhizobium rosettiformans]MDR7065959.1 putative multiple sugar transport system ATP-binding protein [Rhizobium rosettiformans]THV37252.1 sugar ABC trans
MDNIILEMRGITKTFPGVKALDNVSFKVREGEIHALVGENGAGKSTLMKVLSGVYPAGTYDGDIYYDGEVRRFARISDSEELGIIIIHQELALVPLLSIAENIFLGNEIAQKGVIHWPQTFARTKELLAKVGLKDAPSTRITDIGVGKQQLVEIAKALSKKVRLLILDEPTASLNETDSDALLTLLMEFRKQGMTSIIISHKLNEIRKVADKITIIRDGGTVETLDCHTQEITEDRIIKGMVGRDMEDRYPKRDPKIGDVLLEVKNWNVFHQNHRDRQFLHDVAFNVRAGEVVGIAGLMGAGRTETAMSIFGKSWGHKITGDVSMHGKPVDVSTIPKAISAGLAYVTEDRKHLGLVLQNNIKENTTLANLDGVSSGTVIDDRMEAKVASDYRQKLRIRSHSIYQEAVNLSGGNQQKVVLSKWLFTNPEILILDEPTRGIDVGAKFEIYTIINQLAAEGKGILMISSEMPELLGTCDRIYVMNEGRIVAELTKEEASQESIMRAIMRSGEKH